ncbi:ABC transporter permease [Actinomadura barringtoniae]|nr:ABC transporter permease [Actinomadura barringtoniae]
MRVLMVNEYLKLRTVRGPWLLFAAGPVLVVIGIAGLVTGGADVDDPATASKAAAHVGLMSLIMLIFGVLAVAGEHRHRTITDTYLSEPRRGRVIVAKLSVYAGAGVIFGVLLAATALVASAVAFSIAGGSLDLSDGDLWRTLAGGVVWNAAFTGIGVAVGALIRSPAGAIATALAWIALVEGLVGQLIGDLGRWLPFSSGRAAGLLPGSELSQSTGMVVLLCYVAAFAIVAVTVTARRDVT